jgi:hypothetical protein
MRIYDVLQGSEEWEALRHRPTASNFDKIITPARGQLSAQMSRYACEIVAKRLGVYVESPPSFWMEWGTEHEPVAVDEYEKQTGRKTRQVGFAIPDWTEEYGGSPDRLVDPDGLLEVKCPAPETLIGYHAAGVLPSDYVPQVQGLLWITGRQWCDFYAWHPQLTPFLIRVEPDTDYHAKLREGLAACLLEIERIAKLVQSHPEVMETWNE